MELGLWIGMTLFQVGVVVFQFSAMFRMNEKDQQFDTLLRSYGDVCARCLKLESGMRVLKDEYDHRYPNGSFEEDVRVASQITNMTKQ
jgi:hypothetical protein